MPPTDIAAATNARVVTRVEYTIDPRGWGMVAGLNRLLQRGIAGGRNGSRVGPRHERFNGVTPSPPQVFAGLADLGLGTARPVTPAATRLENARSVDDPARAMLTARARRRQ